jgi:transposase
MEILEVMRRWQAGASRRAIARGLGVARATVDKYVAVGETLELRVGGPPPTEDQTVALVRAGHPKIERARPAQSGLMAQREQIHRWLSEDHLQLTRVQELLAQERVHVPYTTLRRFVAQEGLGQPPKATVRMADTAPGEVAEMDFDRLGPLLDPIRGKRRIVWALVVVLCYSRHAFVWPLFEQTLPEVIAGLEAAWVFFGGVVRRLVLDNFPAAVAGTDPLAPRLTRGFLAYSQARGFVADPARVRHPQDKPRVERHIDYVTERFWKGGDFRDLADSRSQAREWSLTVAGQRVHGTTRRVPVVVFTDEERALLLPLAATPAGEAPYDPPTWRTVSVHADQHIQFAQALYSVPRRCCPPGTKLEVQGDRSLVRLWYHGEIVKVHPRQPKGGRTTDPADYPTEKTTYALRAPDRLVRQATDLGENVGRFAQRLVAGPLPWAALRQGAKLLQLAERYSPTRLDAACARALGFDLIDVRRLERILLLALEHEDEPLPPEEDRVCPLPLGRFTRPASAFAHQDRAVPPTGGER